MSVENLTNDDIETLMEALVSWENKDTAGNMLGSLIGALIIPKDNEQAQLEYKQHEEQSRAKLEKDSKIRKERSILLQAKLIQLKTTLITNEYDSKIRSAI